MARTPFSTKLIYGSVAPALIKGILVLLSYSNIKELIRSIDKCIKIVVVYSITIAFLSLILPISVQSLINVVSFGSLLQPILILSLLLFVILGIAAAIRVAQSIVVETIQQTIFVKIGIWLSKLLPRIHMVNFHQHRVSELVNYFFEVQTIQKSLASILVTGIDLVMLSIFSMTLIALYHPILLIFDIILVIAIMLAFYIPFRDALKYAVEECQYKHSFVAWLEEIVNNIFLFKMHDNRHYAIQVSDKKIAKYLTARKKHFSKILQHALLFNAIYVIANATLLGLGGYLVVKEQMSIGQLVAAELIVNAFLYGFLRFSNYLEEIYDLLASSSKLSVLLEISQDNQLSDKQSSHALAIPNLKKNPLIEIKNLSYKFNENSNVFQNLTFKVPYGEVTVIQGQYSSGKSLLVDLILGFREKQSGMIQINDIPISDCDILAMRERCALLRRIEIFSGTLLENLTLHNDNIEIRVIYDLIEKFNLGDTISRLENGLNTYLSGSQMTMSSNEYKKLMLIRDIITQPDIFFIDGFLDNLPDESLELFLAFFNQYPGTVLITTQRKKIASYFKNRVLL